MQLVEFLIWKLPDHRYSQVLVEVARITIDMYASVIGLSQSVDGKLLKELSKTLEDQIELQRGLLELSGQIDMITRIASLKSGLKKRSSNKMILD